MIESSIWVPTVRGSKATLTPVPKMPFDETPTQLDKNTPNKMINKLTIKEITDIISHNKEVSKKEIYNYCLKIKNEI